LVLFSHTTTSICFGSEGWTGQWLVRSLGWIIYFSGGLNIALQVHIFIGKTDEQLYAPSY